LDEHIVEVALAVRHVDQGGVRTLRRQGLAGTQTVHPLPAFLLGARGAVPFVGGAAKAPAGARPGLGVEQAQRLACRRQRQGGVQQQAQGLVAIVADGAQPLGLRMSRVVERGGVLGAEHDRMGAGANQGGLRVGGQNVLRGDLVVVEEPIGGFGFGPRAAGLGDGGGGVLRKIGRHDDQSLDPPPVRERRRREFFLGPLGLTLASQSRQRTVRLRPLGAGPGQGGSIHSQVGVRNRGATQTTCAAPNINY